jgi:hypothetical protein
MEPKRMTRVARNTTQTGATSMSIGTLLVKIQHDLFAMIRSLRMTARWQVKLQNDSAT